MRLDNGYNVGDIVYYISENRGRDIVYGRVTDKRDVKALRDDIDTVWAHWGSPDGIKNFNRRVGFMPTDRVFLHKAIEPEVPKIIPATPFVFIEEGDDYVKVGSGDYQSLDDAQARCIELRRIYKTNNIFSYVRVEK